MGKGGRNLLSLKDGDFPRAIHTEKGFFRFSCKEKKVAHVRVFCGGLNNRLHALSNIKILLAPVLFVTFMRGLTYEKMISALVQHDSRLYMYHKLSQSVFCLFNSCERACVTFVPPA